MSITFYIFLMQQALMNENIDASVSKTKNIMTTLLIPPLELQFT